MCFCVGGKLAELVSGTREDWVVHKTEHISSKKAFLRGEKPENVLQGFVRQISRIGLKRDARVLIHAGNVSSLDGLSSALLNINVFLFFSIVIFMQFF